MMKKLFVGFTVAVMMVVGLVACQGEDGVSDTLEKLRANSNGSQYQVFIVADNGQKHTDYFDSIPYNDDFNFSTYKITKVDGNDVYGDVIKSLGSTIEDNNSGVYLDARELDFNVKEGDKVMVIFENGYDDAILEVKKIVDSMTKVDVKEWNGFMVLDRHLWYTLRFWGFWRFRAIRIKILPINVIGWIDYKMMWNLGKKFPQIAWQTNISMLRYIYNDK